MAETCEEIIADLLEWLQGVDGQQTVDRGEHKVPEKLEALPAIILLEGEDDVNEVSRRGSKRDWPIYLALIVAGSDADSMLYDLATFRMAVKRRMKDFRGRMGQWNGSIYETGRGIPMETEQGNYVVAQTLAYLVKYVEPPLT